MGNKREYTVGIKADDSIKKLRKELEDLKKQFSGMADLPLGDLKSIDEIQERIDSLERQLEQKVSFTAFKDFSEKVVGYTNHINDSITNLLDNIKKLGDEKVFAPFIEGAKNAQTRAEDMSKSISLSLQQAEKKLIDNQKKADDRINRKNQERLDKSAQQTQKEEIVSKENVQNAESVGEALQNNLDTQKEITKEIKEQNELLDENKKKQEELNNVQEKKSKGRPKGSKNKAKEEEKSNAPAENMGVVGITLEVPDEAKEELKKNIQAVCDEITAEFRENPVEIQVAFVSNYKTKRKIELIEQLQKKLDDVKITIPDDEKSGKKLRHTIEDIKQQIDHDLRQDIPTLNFQSNMSDLVKEITAGVDEINHKFATVPLDADVHFDGKQVQEELKKLKDISITIDKMEFSRSFLENLQATDELLEKRLNAEENGAEELSEEENQKLQDLVDKAMKVAELTKKISHEIGRIPLNGEFDESQLQEALNAITGLKVAIEELDVTHLKGINLEGGTISGIHFSGDSGEYSGDEETTSSSSSKGRKRTPTSNNNKQKQEETTVNKEKVNAEKKSADASKDFSEETEKATEQVSDFTTKMDKAAKKLSFKDGIIDDDKAKTKTTAFLKKFVKESNNFKDATLLSYLNETGMFGEGQVFEKNRNILEDTLASMASYQKVKTPSELYKEQKEKWIYEGREYNSKKAAETAREKDSVEAFKDAMSKAKSSPSKVLKKEEYAKKAQDKVLAKTIEKKPGFLNTTQSGHLTKRGNQEGLEQIFQSMLYYGVNRDNINESYALLDFIKGKNANVTKTDILNAFFEKYPEYKTIRGHKEETKKRKKNQKKPETYVEKEAKRKETQQKLDNAKVVNLTKQDEANAAARTYLELSKKDYSFAEHDMVQMVDDTYDQFQKDEEARAERNAKKAEKEAQKRSKELADDIKKEEQLAKKAEQKSEKETQREKAKAERKRGKNWQKAENKVKKKIYGTQEERSQMEAAQLKASEYIANLSTDEFSKLSNSKVKLEDQSDPDLARFWRSLDKEQKNFVKERRDTIKKSKLRELFRNYRNNGEADELVDFLMENYPPLSKEGKAGSFSSLLKKAGIENEIKEINGKQVGTLDHEIAEITRLYNERNEEIAWETLSPEERLKNFANRIQVDAKGKIVENDSNMRAIDNYINALEETYENLTNTGKQSIKSEAEKHGFSKGAVQQLIDRRKELDENEKAEKALEALKTAEQQLEKKQKELDSLRATKGAKRITEEERLARNEELRKSKEKQPQVNEETIQDKINSLTQAILVDKKGELEINKQNVSNIIDLISTLEQEFGEDALDEKNLPDITKATGIKEGLLKKIRVFKISRDRESASNIRTITSEMFKWNLGDNPAIKYGSGVEKEKATLKAYSEKIGLISDLKQQISQYKKEIKDRYDKDLTDEEVLRMIFPKGTESVDFVLRELKSEQDYLAQMKSIATGIAEQTVPKTQEGSKEQGAPLNFSQEKKELTDKIAKIGDAETDLQKNKLKEYQDRLGLFDSLEKTISKIKVDEEGNVKSTKGNIELIRKVSELLKEIYGDNIPTYSELLDNLSPSFIDDAIQRSREQGQKAQEANKELQKLKSNDPRRAGVRTTYDKALKMQRYWGNFANEEKGNFVTSLGEIASANGMNLFAYSDTEKLERLNGIIADIERNEKGLIEPTEENIDAIKRLSEALQTLYGKDASKYQGLLEKLSVPLASETDALVRQLNQDISESEAQLSELLRLREQYAVENNGKEDSKKYKTFMKKSKEREAEIRDNIGGYENIKQQALAGDSQTFLDSLVKNAKDMKVKGMASFAKIGEAVPEGYSEGIKSREQLVDETANEMVKVAIESAKEAQDSHSPSKKFKKIGQDAAQGYVDGINSMRKEVDDAAEKLNLGSIEDDVARNKERTKNSPRITLSDEYSNPLTFYRGLRSKGAGVVSSHNFSGSYWTIDPNLASLYSAEKILGKVFKSNLSMKNPLEVDAKGKYHNEISYIAPQDLDLIREMVDIIDYLPHYDSAKRRTDGLPGWDDEEKRNDVEWMFTSFSQSMFDHLIEEEKKALAKTKWKQKGMEKLSRLEDLWKTFKARTEGENRTSGIFTTEQLAQYALKNGYGGLIIDNVIDGGKDPTTVAVSFDEKDIQNLEQGKALQYLESEEGKNRIWTMLTNYMYYKNNGKFNNLEESDAEARQMFDVLGGMLPEGELMVLPSETLNFARLLPQELSQELEKITELEKQIPNEGDFSPIQSAVDALVDKIYNHILDKVSQPIEEPQNKDNEKWWIKQSKENYLKTNATIESIKNNPDAHSVSPEMMQLIRSGAFDKDEGLQNYIDNIATKKGSTTWKQDWGNIKNIKDLAKVFQKSAFSKVEGGLDAFAELYNITDENKEILRHRYNELNKSLEHLSKSVDTNTNAFSQQGGYLGKYWYNNYAANVEQSNTSLDKRIDDDIATFYREADKGNLSEVELFDKLEKEYFGYLNQLLGESDKDSKQYIQEWKARAKERFDEQRKVYENENQQREQLAQIQEEGTDEQKELLVEQQVNFAQDLEREKEYNRVKAQAKKEEEKRKAQEWNDYKSTEKLNKIKTQTQTYLESGFISKETRSSLKEMIDLMEEMERRGLTASEIFERINLSFPDISKTANAEIKTGTKELSKSQNLQKKASEKRAKEQQKKEEDALKAQEKEAAEITLKNDKAKAKLENLAQRIFDQVIDAVDSNGDAIYNQAFRHEGDAIASRIKSMITARSDGTYRDSLGNTVENISDLMNDMVVDEANRFLKRKGAKKNKNQNKDSLDKLITSTEKIVNADNISDGLRTKATDFLNQLLKIKNVTELTTEEFKKLVKEADELNESARQDAQYSKEKFDVISKLDKITGRLDSKTGLSFYSPEIVERAQYYKNNIDDVGIGTANSFISETLAGNPQNIRGDIGKLNDLIAEAQRLANDDSLGKKLQGKFRGFIDEADELKNASFVSRDAINQMGDAFVNLKRKANEVKGNFFTEIGVQLSHLNAKFIASYMSLQDLIRYGRHIISTITELDTALTEMRKVSDDSLQTLKEYQKTTFDTAGALGTTAVQLQQSTADWLRLGESLDEASKSAVAATTLFNVSEFENVNQATEALVSMSQAYKELDKTEIIDVLNNIGNNYSIATDQLATALQASSAALVTQGNDLYEAAALVTAGNAIIQDASKVGTGIRTISLRIAGVKEGDDDIREELEELGEEVDDWVVSTEAKKRQVIMDYTRVASNNGKGVDILDSNGNLKNTYTILLEISKIYKEIQEEDKKYGTNRAKGLVEELAGKVRSNIAASILMNPELLENVYESAMNSGGSAAEENAKYLDSIVGKTQQFKNELQELEQNALDSQLIKDVIDLGTGLLSILNEAGDILPTIIAGVGALGVAIIALKNDWVSFIDFNQDTNTLSLFGMDVHGDGRKKLKSALKGLRDEFENIYNSPDGFGGFFKKQVSQGFMTSKEFGENFLLGFRRNLTGVFQNDGIKQLYGSMAQFSDVKSITEIFDANGQMPQSIATLKNQFDDLDESAQNMVRGLANEGVDNLEKFTMAEKAAGVAGKVASVGVGILKSVATMGLSLLATFAISKIVSHFKELADASTEASRAANEFSSSLKTVHDTIKSNSDYVDEIAERYVELSKGVDSTGQNIRLSTEDYKEFNDISQELASRFPEMINYWDENGNAILKTADSVEVLNKAYEENRKLSLQRILSDEDNGAESVFKNFKELKNANILERFKSAFTKNKSAGIAEDYDILKKEYEAFLKLTYEDYQNLYGYGTGESNVSADDKILIRNLVAVGNSKYAKKHSMLGISKQATEEEFNTARAKAEAYLSTIEQDMADAIGKVVELGNVYLELNPKYETLDEDMKGIAKQIVNTLDEETIESFNDDPIQLGTWVAQGLNTLEKVKVPVSDLFDVDTNSGSFAENRQAALEAWKATQKAFGDEIDKAQSEAEKERLRKQRDTIFEASGLGDINEFYSWTQNSLSAIAKTDRQYEELTEKTKDFTKENWELWLSVTNGAQTASEAIKAYDNEFAKVRGATKYSGIGALLSQDSFLAKGTQARYETMQSQYSEAVAKGDLKRVQNLQEQMDELHKQEADWGDVRKDLVGMAQAGKLDEDSLKQYKYFDEILKALGVDAEKTDDAIKEMIKSIEKMSVNNAIDQLDNYKQGIDHLDEAYQQYKNGKLIDATMLNDIQSTFGNLEGEAFDNFANAVMTGEKNLQPYFDAIVNDYAKQETALGELTEENKEWVEQQLVASGITKKSAHETIESILAEKRALEGTVSTYIKDMNNKIDASGVNNQYKVSVEDVNEVTAKQVANLIKLDHEIDANTTSTYDEATALELEKVKLSEAEQAVIFFTLKKELSKDMSMRNEEDINYLLQIIKLAGLGGEAIDRMKKLMLNYNTYKDKYEAAVQAKSDFLHGRAETSIAGGEQARLQQLQSTIDQYESLLTEVDTFNDETMKELEDKYSQFDYTSDLKMKYGGAVDSNKQSAEDALQQAKETLEKILAMYDAELDAGVVSFQTYVDKSRAIIQQYYDQGKIKAQDYYDYLANLYEKQVGQYDKVISAVQKKLQDETDALEKQKENVEKSYNEQIEVIQKKIDALQDENDEIDRNMELSKAQYELARARNQRTRLMYSETRGFYYEADLKGISEAEENVRKAKVSRQVAEYEKQIKSLQDAMQSETETIDEQIKKLNEYSQKWGEVSSTLENAINAQRAAEVLGQNWEQDILNQRMDLLEQFTQNYVALQQAQRDAYLEARKAEASAPIGGSGGGAGDVPAPSGTGPKSTDDPKDKKTDTDDPKTTTYTDGGWYYNGTLYPTYSQANAEKERAEKKCYDDAYKTAYDNAYNKYKSMPEGMRTSKASSEAETEAQKALKTFQSNKYLTRKTTTHSYWSGTDSAKAGESLVGELGSEIVLHKNGTASIVDEPTLMDMQGGEKVFNAEETEKILKSKYKPLSSVNPNKFKMLHSFAGGTTSATQRMIAAQAVGIANGIKTGMVATSTVGGQTINQTFNVTLPNITDASKATDLMREFQQMSMKATQYFKRRD